MIIDSHCHLNLFDPDHLSEIVRDSEESGVSLLLSVCIALRDFVELKSIAERFPSVYFSAGIHPNEAQGSLSSDELVALYRSSNKVVAFGETGLDCYREGFNIGNQKADFAAHIEAAARVDLPVIIHSRNADLEMKDFLISEMRNSKFKGVLHSFASSLDLCKVALDLGLYISFSGIVTFKNAKEVQKAAAYVPSDRILTETDSPYLAPVPHRGHKNHPQNVKIVLDYLKNLRQDDDLERKVEENFFRLFSCCKSKT